MIAPLRYSEGPDSMSWFSAIRGAKRALYGGRIKRLEPERYRVEAGTEAVFCTAPGRTGAEALQNALEAVQP